MPKKSTNADVIADIAANVRYARGMLRLSQEELAEAAGLHRTRVGTIERADAAATVDSVASLARAIGVPAHVLLMAPKLAQPVILEAVGIAKPRGR